jgi:hypothetical protein
MAVVVEEEEEAVEASPTVRCINRVKTVVVDEEMTTVAEAIAEVGMNVVVVVVVVVVGDWSNNGVQMI